MPDHKPQNRPVKLRAAQDWPTKRAKESWRRRKRKRIAQTAQAERDREAQQRGY